MNLLCFYKNLNIKAPDECFEPIFQSALAEYKSAGVFFLEKEYITHINSFCGCISRQVENITKAAQLVKENEMLSVFALFVYRAMLDRDAFLNHLSDFEFPKDKTPAYDFLPFLILLPTIENIYNEMTRRNIDEEIIRATLMQYEDCIYIYSERFDKFGLNKRYFDHLQRYVDCEIFNIGRLRFEIINKYESPVLVLKNSKNELAVLFDGVEINESGMLKGTPPNSDNTFYADVYETDDYIEGYKTDDFGLCESQITKFYKTEWQTVLKKGDGVISIHIPDKGSFTNESVEESIRSARSFFGKYYPEFNYKAFHCHSWMLDPSLREILKPTANLVSFQKLFKLYAGKTSGEDVFNFVFKNKFTNFEDMPEETTLQRGIKNRYLNGKYIYEFEGVFL